MQVTTGRLMQMIKYPRFCFNMGMVVSACLWFMGNSVAAPYTPKETSEVVATWKVFNATDQQMSLDDISDFIEQGQYPGEADYRYGRAKAWLQAKMANTSPNAQTYYLYARVLQHQHQFDRAIKALERSIELKPTAINSWLLKANIHLVQGDIVGARQACLTLMGKADILLISTCALEVTSQNGKLVESYKELARLYELYQPSDEPEKSWIVQILADMALKQGLAEQALDYLNQAGMGNAPVSLLALWSDVQLSLNQHQQVYDKLSKVVSQNAIQDDALLLRLAIAEKQLGNTVKWQWAFAQRVKLREQRQDSLHASDLANYYLKVDIQPKKALYWAKINWQVARQANDRILLEQAKELFKKTENDKKSVQVSRNLSLDNVAS
ncbi:tetratricopeptide repeat protein [Shewanella livingstonensis]|uniref:Tetratricopeptide repeat protein n=1 Tax=Shewanella livingstonensis TaxID=150120 RepID=A0A3G8LWD1_9GAMM|nr:CDC27 family protein [Shewanella livingstonensis]AZG73921.1 tetratricopeptide repeat protein [Shewanella livingstonensis]